MLKKNARYFLYLALLTTAFAAGYRFHRPAGPASFVEERIGNQELKRAHWGLVIRDLDSGTTLVSQNGEKNFIPASVTKLFTTACALTLLGENYQFETMVLGEIGSIREGTLPGTVLLKGSGDPSLTSDALGELAKQVKASGIDRIAGKIVVSGFKYDDTTLIPHAEWEDLTWYYAPEVHALSVDGNAETLRIEAAKAPGLPAEVICEGNSACLTVLNLTTTISSKEKAPAPSIKLTRGFNDNRVILSGEMPLQHPALIQRIAVHNPSEHAKKKFIECLQQEGVAYVENNTPVSFSRAQGKLASHLSKPLSEIVRHMNKTSDNLAAELLVQAASYRLGPDAPPAFIQSGKPAFDFIREWGEFDWDSSALTGGAGISRHNSLRPLDAVGLLQKLYDSPFRKTLMSSLPVAGVDGTLAGRFKGTIAENNLIAKTGTLSGVSCLAGYARTKNGKNICFCLMVNQYHEEADVCRNEMDKLMVSYLESL